MEDEEGTFITTKVEAEQNSEEDTSSGEYATKADKVQIVALRGEKKTVTKTIRNFPRC